MPEPVKKKCLSCKKVKPIDEFGYSRRKGKPTATCKRCWGDPIRAREIGGSESAEELSLYYSDIRALMTDIHTTQAQAAADGGTIDRPVANLQDVWLSEMTEEAYREIVRALIRKAQNGDAVASKLLLEERHRRAGEPSKDGVEEAFEALFRVDPLTPGLDSM